MVSEVILWCLPGDWHVLMQTCRDAVLSCRATHILALKCLKQMILSDGGEWDATLRERRTALSLKEYFAGEKSWLQIKVLKKHLVHMRNVSEQDDSVAASAERAIMVATAGAARASATSFKQAQVFLFGFDFPNVLVHSEVQVLRIIRAPHVHMLLATQDAFPTDSANTAVAVLGHYLRGLQTLRGSLVDIDTRHRQLFLEWSRFVVIGV